LNELTVLQIDNKLCKKCDLRDKQYAPSVCSSTPPAPIFYVLADKPNREEQFYGLAGQGRENDFVREILDKAMGRRLTRQEVCFSLVVRCFCDKPTIRKSHKEACKVWLDKELALLQPRHKIAVGKAAGEVLSNSIVLPNRYQLMSMGKGNLNKVVKELRDKLGAT
jgi:uracil-DNA glycosylase family 4